MKDLKKFRLVKENSDSYEIHDTRDKKHFLIAKKDLDLGMHARLSKIQHFDAGGETQGVSADNSDDSATPPPVTVNVNSQPENQQPINVPVPAAFQPHPAAPAVQPGPAQNIPSVPAAPTYEQQGIANEKLSEQGIQGKAAADQKQALLERNYLDSYNNQLADAQAAYKTNVDKNAKEYDQLHDAVIKGDIDPNHWINSKGTAGKIGMAIAVALGGLGQGLSHSNTNQALQVMQNQINNDIDAQKANLGKKTTLLSMNMARYRDLGTAMAATRAQMSAMLEGQLKQAAAQTGSQRAIANAQYASGMLRNEYLKQAPGLAMEDYKLNALHQLNGTAPEPTAGTSILNDTNSKKSDGATDASVEGTLPIPGGRRGQVDLKRLNLYQASDIMPKEDVANATKEAGDFQEAQATKGLLQKDLAQMVGAVQKDKDQIKNTSGIGVSDLTMRRTQDALGQIPIIGNAIQQMTPWGGDIGKDYAAGKASALNKINTLLTKRLGGEGMKNIAIDLPDRGDSPEQIRAKLQRVNDLIDSNTKTPTLERYKLIK